MRHAMKAIAAALAVAVSAPAFAAAQNAKPLATVFKDPQCGCCEAYAEHLRTNGYPVKVVATHDLALIKQRQGIPADLGGCHTTLIGGYFVDGHVPIATFDRLLDQRPEIDGISLPGMPAGSPGMGGPKSEPFTVYALAPGGRRTVFSVE